MDAFVAEAVRPFVARPSAPIRPVGKQVWADGEHVIIQWDGTGFTADGEFVDHHTQHHGGMIFHRR